MTQNPLYLQNAYEFLGTPGDWYLQTDSNVVYYIPRPQENMTQAVVEAPVAQQFFTLEGSSGNPVKNIRFEGLVFQNTTWLFPAPGYGLPQDQANQPHGTTSNWSVTAAIDATWAGEIDIGHCDSAIWAAMGSIF